MDLMSAIRSTDHNQPNNNRSASLKVKSRTQSKSTEKATQMAHSEHSLKRLQSHRLSDYNDCCDNKVLTRKRLRQSVFWEGFLVFSLTVLINIASINCIATRQLEGEFIFFFYNHHPPIDPVIFTTLSFDLFSGARRKLEKREISVNWNLSLMKQNI